MNYTLTNATGSEGSPFLTLRKLWPLLQEEKLKLVFAFFGILSNAALNLFIPFVVGYAVDNYVQTGNYAGVLLSCGVLLLLFLASLVVAYMQTIMMGSVAQRMLFNLRNTIFRKLQELPVAFFNQNKAGDLISRINNDTDKLNMFFSQSLMQFMGNLFMMLGAAMFLLIINWKLGLATLLPSVGLFIFTQAVSGWVQRKNAASLQRTGSLSAEIQESLQYFKVIVAFNRRDFFRKRFSESNTANFTAALKAGNANNIFIPIYGFSSNIASLIVLSYGIVLILDGEFTVGLLISYLTYVTRFYDPLRQIAALWASFQTAMAGWDRITAILSMKSDQELLLADAKKNNNSLLTFENVHFAYPDGKEVLRGIDFTLERGKTYALVGPTGGGKTTTASLMARLYDPTEGIVLLNGKDIRSYEPAVRTQKIGFILQEPFLFLGTLRDNILYGNEAYQDLTSDQLKELLTQEHLAHLLARFEQGLDTPVTAGGETISLGQRQLIAFMRAVLRHPELLILDEATANIDTVTEQLLEDILRKLPRETTKVIIAHRLNTIENADEIFFVNAGEIIRAGSMEHALEMLMHGKRAS